MSVARPRGRSLGGRVAGAIALADRGTTARCEVLGAGIATSTVPALTWALVPVIFSLFMTDFFESTYVESAIPAFLVIASGRLSSHVF